MTIVWTPSTGTATTLCHGTERGAGKATGPFAEVVSHPEDTQVDKRIRAAAATLIDRGNRIHEYQFSVTELFSTLVAAASAQHKRRSDLLRTGSLAITNGGQTITYGSAILEIPAATRRGSSIVWTYKIMAQTFTATGTP
jgi:hypothetical protein